MHRKLLVYACIAVSQFLGAGQSTAQANEGALARCGASKGTGYFFKDQLFNPEGPDWSEDGISNGKIVLIRLGDEWDIQFDDSAGAYGYRQDGATVIVLGATDEKLTIGAFAGTYADVYTFNFSDREVLWTSHKIGAGMPKVAVYRADCDFIAGLSEGR